MAAGKENIPPPEPVAQGQGSASKGKKSKICFVSPNDHFFLLLSHRSQENLTFYQVTLPKMTIFHSSVVNGSVI
jgi:hypothetical protein